MRKKSSWVNGAVAGSCGLMLALCISSQTPSQETAPMPEYFGFYALDRGKLIAIGGGTSDTPPTLQSVSVISLGASQPSERNAVQLGASAHFLLFDVSPAEAARAISIFRLPFVRREITVSDIPQMGNLSGRGATTVGQRNLPGLMRLADSQIRLLQKPVRSEPQMIELVPDQPLTLGLYGVLFAPASGVTAGGVGGGQNPGWTALLLVGQSPMAEQSGQCIDLVLTGGVAGMLGLDSPDVGSIGSFPLLRPDRAPFCSSVANSSEQPGAPTSPPAQGHEVSQAELHALETSDCTEGEQTVPAHSHLEFVVSPLRECWTPWLVFEKYGFKVKESGNILLQHAFRDGSIGEQFEDGPKLTFHTKRPIEKIRFKSLRNEPVTITLDAW